MDCGNYAPTSCLFSLLCYYFFQLAAHITDKTHKKNMVLRILSRKHSCYIVFSHHRHCSPNRWIFPKISTPHGSWNRIMRNSWVADIAHQSRLASLLMTLDGTWRDDINLEVRKKKKRIHALLCMYIQAKHWLDRYTLIIEFVKK